MNQHLYRPGKLLFADRALRCLPVYSIGVHPWPTAPGESSSVPQGYKDFPDGVRVPFLSSVGFQ